MTMRSVFSIILLTTALLIAGGCATKKKTTETDGDMGASMDDQSGIELNADSDSGNAGMLQTVFFEFNSSMLTSAAKTTLEENADFLTKNPNIEIQIEGHCDERGGIQYNIALGEKRASTVRKFFTSLGIDASRITTVTFGKERPIAFGHDEDAWSKNRRGNFVVTAIGE